MTRALAIIVGIICCLSLPLVTRGGEPDVSALSAAEAEYRTLLGGLEANRKAAIEHAWMAADTQLDDLLKQAMQRGDLDESNRIRMLRKDLSDRYSAGRIVPATKDAPKSAGARKVATELAASMQKIETEHARGMEKAGKTCVDALEQAEKAALKSGLLDQANNLHAARTRIAAEVRLRSAGFPPDAQAVYTFDRDTLFKKDGKDVVRDLSGRENHLLGTEIRLIPGRLGQAVAFARQAPRLTSLNSVGLSHAQPRTLAFWAYFDVMPSGEWHHIAGWGKNANAQSFYAATYSNKFLLWAYGTDHGFDTVAEARVWHHHAILYDGKALQWRIDGATIERKFDIAYNTADSPLAVGTENVAVDDLVIYPRVLTEAELQLLLDRAQRR